MEFCNGIVASLAAGDFRTGSYDIGSKNCNHFSNAMCVSLVGVQIPPWVNRAASIGSSLRPSSLAPDVDRSLTQRYSQSGLKKIQSKEETSPSDSVSSFSSLFSWMWGSKSLERSTVQGEVAVVITEKKELTQQQKDMLAKIKSQKGGSG